MTVIGSPGGSELNALLNQYVNDDHSMPRRIAALRSSLDSAAFYAQAAEALTLSTPSPALKSLVSDLKVAEVFQILLSIYLKSREQAISVFKKLLLFSQRLDIDLLTFFEENEEAEWSDQAILAVLDLLDAVSQGERLVLKVSRYLEHQSPKLRSKAALFIGRRKPRLSSLASLFHENDPRIRANIIESLHGADEAFVAPIFRKYVSDSNCRAAGNAVLGLYRLGQPDAIQLLDDMTVDERPQFRQTAAWVMGESGDPRFASNLAKLIRDTEPAIRQRALKSLAKIRPAVEELRNGNLFQTRIIHSGVDPDSRWLLATVTDNSNAAIRNLAATQFLLKAGDQYVRDYCVTEFSCLDPIHVVVLWCLPVTPSAELEDAFASAKESCSQLKRNQDTLSFCSVSSEEDVQNFGRQPVIAVQPGKPNLPFVDLNSAQTRMILVGAGPNGGILPVLLQESSTLLSRLHLIAITSDWNSEHVRRQIDPTRWFSLPYSEANQLSSICGDAYASLKHHYRMTWTEREGNLDLKVLSARVAG